MSDQQQEQRLIELETKFAYQEETLRALNEVVTAQQNQIERLNAICRQLVERAKSGDGGMKGVATEEIPPHY